MQPQTKAHLLLDLLISRGWCAKQLSSDINSDNKLIDALLNEAIALREAGEAQLSLQLIDQALALGLSSPWLEDNRARALLLLNNRQEASKIWMQLSQTNNHQVAGMAVEMLCKNTDSATDQHSIPGDELNTNSQLNALNEAIKLREEGKLEESITLIDSALAAGETSLWWLDNKARVLVELNNPSEAILIWEHLVAATNDDTGKVASEMLAIHTSKFLEPLLNICKQCNWQPLYLGINDLSVLLQLLQELSVSREAGKIELSLKLIAQAKELGFKFTWIKDNEARALVHLDRLQVAVAQWNNLESNNDPSLVATAVEMLEELNPQLESEKLENQAEQLLDDGDLDAAEALLLNALLTDPGHAGYRELLLRTLAAQLGGGDMLGTETRERELWIEGHSRLLAQFEHRLGLVRVSS